MSSVKHLTESEAGYVAGIVDGERTITLTKNHRGEGRRPVVSISSTEHPLRVTPRNGRYDALARATKEEFERRFFAISTRAPSRAHRPGSR